MKRKLTTIMVADIVGSTPGFEADEEGAARRFKRALQIVADAVGAQGGRVFSGEGDSALAEFDSPVSALRAAIAARTALSVAEDLSAEVMRFGLHVADVIADGAELRGGGVNIAARIESSARPGAIDVSGALYDHVRRVSPCQFEDCGPRNLKGVSDPVRIYRVVSSVDRHLRQTAPTVAQPRSALRPNSVAVLPFKPARQEDEDQQFLADGLTDDLILELSRIISLNVSSRTASHALETSDPVEIGKVLGVRYLLSGTIRKLGDRVQINVVLASTSNGSIVWSDRVRGSFEEVIDLLESISARVAATVAGRIDNAEISAAKMKHPENMTAYEHYLRGLDHHRLAGALSTHAYEARSCFQRAQAADPTFARPLAMEVCAWSYLPDFDLAASEVLLQRALDLDRADPELHRILGILVLKRYRDYAASRRHHDMAISLAPNDAYILGRCAAFYIFVGETGHAMALLDKAEELDPFLPVWIVEERVAALYVDGKFQMACDMARALAFQTRRTRLFRAASRVALGDLEQARKLVAEALADDPTLSCEYVVSQELYKDDGRLTLLLERLQQAGLPKVPEQSAQDRITALAAVS